MSLNRFYYGLKPILPARLRIGLRRVWAHRRRPGFADVWPINPACGRAPEDWPGWPNGKQFAMVLTHDLESQRGLDGCISLLKLEQSLGFRSSFNFIPEGRYPTPPELRDLIAREGFEVGVHDLKHDGKLFWSRKSFNSRAKLINRYLAEWGAVGFRSAFMLRNLDWLHELNVAYDASTFDTDPFEPEPEGVNTIFPFWVPGPNGAGYVELPYTLPQDSTLFVIFQEKTIDIWKKKLDWVAERGGMALLNVHPDYVGRAGVASNDTFCGDLYREFLDYVRTRYEGTYWNALPREVASYVKDHCSSRAKVRKVQAKKKTIWIDLDNTPHVPFFEPIIEQLNRRGYDLLVTARDAFQVCELAEQKKLRIIKVGRHHGKNRALKLAGLMYRALQLVPHVRRTKPLLAVSHGSRSQIIASNLLKIPTVLLADYEHAQHLPFMRPRWEMVPDVIPEEGLYCPKERIRKYPGIKEDVYVGQFRPDPQIMTALGLRADGIVVTARPPATEAHYHNPESEALFSRFMDRACATAGVQVVMLPRNQRQGEALRKQAPHWFAGGRTLIPVGAVDGLNLLWHSDLVVSGGGTMNREAAALGVPVYSIFRGATGAVDRALERERRLVLIRGLDEVDQRILLVRRKRKPLTDSSGSASLKAIIDHLESILKIERERRG